MPMPKIDQPTFKVTIPSTGEEQTYRRMQIPEEKILLMAKESGDPKEVAAAIYQVINNCQVQGDSIDSLCSFDFDYLFIRLYSQSINNVIAFKITDHDDENKEHTFSVLLDSLVIPAPDKTKVTVKINEKYSMTLKYPSVATIDAYSKGKYEEEVDYTNVLLAACVDKVFDEEEEHLADSVEELVKWVGTLPREAYREMKEFLDAMPEVVHVQKYTNSRNEEKEVVLRGIHDFFTFY